MVGLNRPTERKKLLCWWEREVFKKKLEREGGEWVEEGLGRDFGGGRGRGRGRGGRGEN